MSEVIHQERTKHAGQTVKLKRPFLDHGRKLHIEVKIEEWADRLFQHSWLKASGTPITIFFWGRICGLRQAGVEIPIDDEVLYCRTGQYSNLFHVSELELPE